MPSVGPGRAWLLHCSIGAAVAGCHHGSAACAKDSDCASHFCRLDGTCGPAMPDAPAGGDAPGDGAQVACTPDHDGQISSAELPLAAGRSATFRIATNATWDTSGHSNTDGSRTWDLSVQLSGDADRAIALASPSGAWWQPDFAAATYAAPLSASSDLLGVFAVSANAVTLLGVVSPDGGSTKTELTYDPPAQVLAVPITAGATWTSTSTVSGYAQGVPGAYTEQYQSRVDQVGTMTTPYGAFPVLRVETALTRTSGAVTLVTNHTFAWLAECFGPIATAQSKDFESSYEFTADAEVRRLAP
jgi:hypothetical protein